MNETKIENMIDEKVGASAARHYGIIQEFIVEQFTSANELAEARHEQLERNFVELLNEMKRISRNTDTASVDILNLQEKQKKTDVSIKKLNQETESLAGRVGIIEHKYGFA